MRNTAPKGKRVRRLGQAFTEKEARILQKRPTAPGQHGAGHAKLSEFALQMREKQRAKHAYGVTEKQFYSIFKNAVKMHGETGNNLLSLLEQRLDNTVYRLGLATTRKQARQIVSHGFITVNNKPVNIPSFQVKVGDIISLKEVKQKTNYWNIAKEHLAKANVPDWLSFNPSNVQGKVLTLPDGKLHGEQIDSKFIVEHYQRI